MNRGVVVSILAVLPAVSLAQAPPRKPSVWIGPSGVGNGKALRAMFEYPEQ
jgi:hypothetical protein